MIMAIIISSSFICKKILQYIVEGENIVGCTFKEVLDSI